MATTNLRKAAVPIGNLPEPQAAELLGRPAPEQAASFQFLRGLGGEDLLTILADEQPQTIALVLSHLPAEQAAKAVDALDPERQAAVLGRIAAIDPPSPAIVRDVAAGLHRRLVAAGWKPRTSLSGVVKMLSAMRPAAERKLLGEIGQADPDLLGEIRRVMFGDDVAACGAW
jgi:flagellar motor switch protein FliG